MPAIGADQAVAGLTAVTWTVTVHPHGREREPVVVIDGFAPDSDALIEDAASLVFAPIGPYYPGVRAPIAPGVLLPLLTELMPLAAQVFDSKRLDVLEAYHSLVTTPPSALAPIQRLPHFDGVEPGRLALLHYLARDERSGTAFYRHRTTGFETVDAARLPEYQRALQRDVAREGLPGPAYIGGDTALFEQVVAHAGIFNRAILYRSHTLHCALLPEDLSLDPDPRRGRLTVNTFLGERP